MSAERKSAASAWIGKPEASRRRAGERASLALKLFLLVGTPVFVGVAAALPANEEGLSGRLSGRRDAGSRARVAG